MIENFLIPLLLFTGVPVSLPVYFDTGRVKGAAVTRTEPMVRRPKSPVKKRPESLGVRVNAKAAIIVDKESGDVLFEKNKDQVLPIASITKLMSTAVFLDQKIPWDTEVVMQKIDEQSLGGRSVYRGERVLVLDLLYTALVRSDNTAVMALVRSTGETASMFVDRMNEKVSALGLTHSRFVDPTGLDHGNASTAYDIARLGSEVFQNEKVRDATTRKTYTFRPLGSRYSRVVKSTNQLLSNSVVRITAGKTGHITESGYCLVAEVENENGNAIIVAVLGASTNEDRFQDVKALGYWAFENYAWEPKNAAMMP